MLLSEGLLLEEGIKKLEEELLLLALLVEPPTSTLLKDEDEGKSNLDKLDIFLEELLVLSIEGKESLDAATAAALADFLRSLLLLIGV